MGGFFYKTNQFKINGRIDAVQIHKPVYFIRSIRTNPCIFIGIEPVEKGFSGWKNANHYHVNEVNDKRCFRLGKRCRKKIVLPIHTQ